MSKFKTGDRVIRVPFLGDRSDEGRIATITTAYSKNGYNYVSVLWDVSEATDNLANTIGMTEEKFIHLNKNIQKEREDYACNYAEWFAQVYTNISMAGGDPISFIEKLPKDVIDTMVRNHLYVMYKGPMEGID